MNLPHPKFFFLLLTFIIYSVAQNKYSTPIHQKYFGVSLQGIWTKKAATDKILSMNDYINTTSTTSGIIIDFTSELYKKKLDPFFKSNNGSAQILISAPEQKSKKSIIYIQLLGDKYLNNQVIQFAFAIDKGYNKSVNQWKTPKFLTPVRLFRNLKHFVTLDIEMYFQMKQNPKSNTVEIRLLSESGNIIITAQILQQNNTLLIIFSVINALQIIMLLCFSKNQNILGNTSQWLILQQCFYIILQTFFLIRLCIGYFDTIYKWLAISIVTNILIMMLILRKFEAVIQKFRNKLKFVLALTFCVLYFRIMFLYYTYSQIWIVESMIFLWQIGYSVSRGGTGGVSLALVGIIILSRIPLLMAMKTDMNVLKIKPDNLAFNIIIAGMLIHLVIIGLQKLLGGRFFVPQGIIPDFFNYLRRTMYGSLIAQETCSICLNQLRAHPEQNEQKAIQRRQNEINIPGFMQTQIQYVSTPCQHSFHRRCLSDWLNTHLVCPLDKRDLPPMNLGAI